MQPVAELVNQNENVSHAATMGPLLIPIEGAYCHSCVALRTNHVSNAFSKVWLGWSRVTGVRLSFQSTYTRANPSTFAVAISFLTPNRSVNGTSIPNVSVSANMNNLHVL